ncbi:MAG TPA: serine hydrolase domain-containing protein [Chloroflexota bacterium]|nr:serine hydrolase domain-containing protein [Chloroflexota bacterium]
MLAAITKPSLTPGPPESVGVSSEGIRRAEEYVQRAVEAGVVPLADVALVRRGILAWRASFVNPELAARGYRLDAASLYYLCSFTKVFVATLIMQQVERGRVMLSRPVADYIPRFATRGKEAVTVRHLLAHASGLPDQLASAPMTLAPVADLVPEICDQPLVFRPGTRASYCTWGFVLLAEILRRVTGRQLEDLGRDDLFEPLGMHHTAFGCPAEHLPRIVPAFDSDLELHPTMNAPNLLTTCRGDIGAFSTADDLAAFGQMMLDGGALNGARVLSPVSVRQMVERQYPWGDTPERLAGAEEHFTTLSKGLGWMVRGAGFFRGSDLMSRRAFFHGGYLGMRVIVDPEYDLVSVFLTSIAATKPSRDPRIGTVGHVAHTFGTLASAAITDL